MSTSTGVMVRKAAVQPCRLHRLHRTQTSRNQSFPPSHQPAKRFHARFRGGQSVIFRYLPAAFASRKIGQLCATLATVMMTTMMLWIMMTVVMMMLGDGDDDFSTTPLAARVRDKNRQPFPCYKGPVGIRLPTSQANNEPTSQTP